MAPSRARWQEATTSNRMHLRKQATLMHWRHNQQGSFPETQRKTMQSQQSAGISSVTGVSPSTTTLLEDFDGSGRAYNRRDFQELFSLPETSESSTGGDSDESDDSLPSVVHVEIPTKTSGLTPFGYNHALGNRIGEHQISEGGSFDLLKYKPTFIHDVFMLPGSLANLLGKGSAEDCVKKMTPGILAGYHCHVQPDTLQPCVIKSSKAHDYVQGIVAFGLGRGSRALLYKHYKPFAKRKTVEVVVEIEVPVQNSGAFERKRRAVAAHAFRWRNKREHFNPERDGETWTLEDYLSGNLGPSQTLLRIDPNMRGDEDEDGYTGRDIEEYEVVEERREVVFGSTGSLQYDRADTFTGW